MKKLILFVAIIALLNSFVVAQFTTVNGFTTTQLVQNILVGSGLSVGPVIQTGGNNQFVKFKLGLPTIGLDSGIVLTTSNMPAGTSTTTGFAGGSGGVPPGSGTNITNYPLLVPLTGVGTINNVAALQFTFTPVGDTLKFKYVFASEEYNTYVNSFNDAFGFFISGPNPAGGNYVDYNIARVPMTTNPVTINNVNNGQNWTCATGPCTNCAYYNDNLCATSPAVATFKFNGFTDPLTAIAAVIPCSTYTIKLAICNALDNAFNSAVFLEAKSFGSNVVMNVSSNSTGSAIVTDVNENCGTATLDIVRTTNIAIAETVTLSYSGTALNGIDVATLPATLNFAPGVTTMSIVIDPVQDGVTEGIETLTISATSVACINNPSTVTFTIFDYAPLAVSLPFDTVTLSCTGGNLPATVSGGVPPVRIRWENGPWLSNVAANQTMNWASNASEWITVSVIDTCGNIESDSVWIDYIQPEFVGYSMNAPVPLNTIEGCVTGTITINRTQNIGVAKTYPIMVSGSASNGTDYTTVPATITFPAGVSFVDILVDPLLDGIPEGIETVTISVNDTLCDGTLVPFTQTINIKSLNPLTLDAGPDILLDCPRINQLINPTVTGGWPQLTYSWNTGPTTPQLNVLPADTTQYIVTVTDSCGYSITDDMWVNVAHDPIANFSFPNLLYCEPSNVDFTDLSVPVSGTNLIYDWSFGDGGTSSSQNPGHMFNVYAIYNVTLTVTNEFGCTNSATQNVQIYPVPTAVPMFNPQNPTTLSPEVTFFNESYPNIISYHWDIAGSSYTDPDFIHTFNGPGTYDCYLMVTNQWGCIDTTDFKVVVEAETSIYIPNSFTPNGDEMNEIFYVYGENWARMELIIFDRWGNEVFYSTDPTKGWDGTFNNSGPTLMVGTYTYKVYIIDFYGKEHNIMGHVNIIR